MFLRGSPLRSLFAAHPDPVFSWKPSQTMCISTACIAAAPLNTKTLLSPMTEPRRTNPLSALSASTSFRTHVLPQTLLSPSGHPYIEPDTLVRHPAKSSTTHHMAV